MTYSNTYYGGVRRWYSDPPEGFNMPFRPTIKENVCFLCVKLNSGDYFAIGTAFFLQARYETSPNRSRFFVVTAKHNIEGAYKNGYSTLYLRLNTEEAARTIIR
jgi:hypothetical protein